MKLLVRNMMGKRSINEARAILMSAGLNIIDISTAQIDIVEKLNIEQCLELEKLLAAFGFELIIDKELILVEKIKAVVIEMIFYSDELPVIKYSEYISAKLKMNYSYLSKYFSQIKRTSIEKFIILLKIERVKQLLLFNDLTLSEIAWKLNYSSPAHLSAQFKKMTGCTPTVFKKKKPIEIIAPEDL